MRQNVPVARLAEQNAPQAIFLTNSRCVACPIDMVCNSFFTNHSGVVCVVCPFADDEKLKNLHVDVALLV
jgi:hypothetical protein